MGTRIVAGKLRAVAGIRISDFGRLLTIVFIVLKLMGTITWSWLWVLSPLLISFVLWAVLVLAVVALSR